MKDEELFHSISPDAQFKHGDCVMELWIDATKIVIRPDDIFVANSNRDALNKLQKMDASISEYKERFAGVDNWQTRHIIDGLQNLKEHSKSFIDDILDCKEEYSQIRVFNETSFERNREIRGDLGNWISGLTGKK